MTWSFQVLGAGCWPLHGYDKEEFAKHTFRARYKGCCLAGGIHGLLDAVLGDLEFHATTFEVDNYGRNEMCHLCGASKTDPGRYFTQTGPTAGWQATRTNNQEWQALMYQSPRPQPELTKIPGLHLLRLMLCGLHTVDGGVMGHWVGNFIWESTSGDRFGPGPREARALKITRAQKAYLDDCKANRVVARSGGDWTVQKFNKKKATNYPFFKGKAAETKHVALWCAGKSLEWNDGTEHASLVAAIGWAVMEYYDVIDNGPRYLPPDLLERLQRSVAIFLQCYLALACEATTARIPAWHWVPKHHMFEHMADTIAPQINPKYVTTYGGEDLVGKIGKLASKCHKRATCKSVLVRYMVMFAYEWGLIGRND